jgi:hypothetical protein
MPGLTESQGKIVREIVQSVPDSGLGQLTNVLTAQMGEHTMAEVRDLVLLEMRDRKVRSIVFSPFLSLCTKNQPGKSHSRFPFILPTLLWNALVDRSPKLMAQARDMASRWENEDLLPYIFNQACDEAIVGLQEHDPRFAPVIECLNRSSPDGVRDLVSFLRMASVLRDVLLELPLWVSRMNQDDALSVRLAYLDVSKLSANGPARLFEIIYTNLDPPWPILRIISAALDRPTDLSIDGTDLAFFGELLLDQSESLVETINDLRLEEGASAGQAAASAAKTIIGITNEFEESIALGKNGPWGRRIARVKRDLTTACEKLIFQVEPLLPKALPVAASNQNQKALNRTPNMVLAPDPVAAARLEAILIFLAAIRPIASASGVGVLRSRVISETQEFLEFYANGVVDLMKDFDQDQQAVRERVHTTSKYVALVHDDAAAEQLRRRVITVARR